MFPAGGVGAHGGQAAALIDSRDFVFSRTEDGGAVDQFPDNTGHQFETV